MTHSPTIDTRRQAALLATFGLSARQIAAVLGVAHHTALRHYQAEFAAGAELAQRAEIERALSSIQKAAGVIYRPLQRGRSSRAPSRGVCRALPNRTKSMANDLLEARLAAVGRDHEEINRQ